MSSNLNSGGHSPAKWFFTVDDQRFPAPRPLITEAILRAQASVPADRVIVRDHNSPNDHVLEAGAAVDLKLGNVFYTVARCDAQPSAPCEAPAKLAFSVDDQVEETLTSTQTGQSLIDLFGVDQGRVLFRDYESPTDQPIAAAEAAKYSDGPVFYTRGPVTHEVEITIDLKVHKVKRGEYTVIQLKGIGGVAPALELEQVVNGVLTPLPDDAKVCIAGGEVFVSHPRSGGSS